MAQAPENTLIGEPEGQDAPKPKPAKQKRKRKSAEPVKAPKPIPDYESIRAAIVDATIEHARAAGASRDDCRRYLNALRSSPQFLIPAWNKAFPPGE